MKRLLATFLVLAALAPYALVLAAETSNSHSLDLEDTQSEYLSIADASQSGLDLNGTNFTIVTYINLETQPTAGNQMAMVGKRNGTGNQRGYYFGVFKTAGGNMQLYFQNSSDGTAFTDVAGSTVTMNTATWYQAAMTYTTGTGAVEFFLDAAAAGTGTGRTSTYNSSSEFDIGRIADGIFYFDGKIDSVYIYNAKLTSSDLSTLDADPCNPSTTNLVSWWRFNNDATDSDGSNNLTENNTPAYSATTAYSCSAGSTPAPDDGLILFE